jgi:hypothetical protein
VMQAAVVRGQTAATWGFSGSSEGEDANSPSGLAAQYNKTCQLSQCAGLRQVQERRGLQAVRTLR